MKRKPAVPTCKNCYPIKLYDLFPHWYHVSECPEIRKEKCVCGRVGCRGHEFGENVHKMKMVQRQMDDLEKGKWRKK